LSRVITNHDKIAIFLPNIPEAAFSFFGVFSIGAVAVPLDFMLTEEEVIHFINHSEAKILITLAKKEINLKQVKAACPFLREIITCREKVDGCTLWEESVVRAWDTTPDTKLSVEDLAAIFYTSGSTGHPKGVMLSYKTLSSPVKNIDHFLKVNDRDIYLCPGVPFSHLGGLDYLLFLLHFGSSLVLMSRFHPLEFFKNIDKHRVTIFCIVPAMYVAVLSLKEYAKFDLSSLRYAVVFGAPSSPVLLKKFHELCRTAWLLNGWGMTETSAPNAFSPEDANFIDSIGKLDFNTEAKLVNEDNQAISGAGQGELMVRGVGIMRGYYKEPTMTTEVLTRDGWLRTGDVVRRDAAGLYFIAGRKKEMIKVAGEIVFSPEVEEKIQRHPKVAEVAVVGVADKLRGEVPKAFIVTKENLSEEELRGFLKEHLAHFKIPHHFEFVRELPKNRTGKIDKQKLKGEPL
jgi:long-chain acyl-CoA synthetase